MLHQHVYNLAKQVFVPALSKFAYAFVDFLVQKPVHRMENIEQNATQRINMSRVGNFRKYTLLDVDAYFEK